MYKRTILVVDDQEINRTILGRMLGTDYTIIYARNGREAMELMREQADVISAVLLDIVMPVMTGYEVLEEMHADAELSKIPVIVSSQKDGDDDEVKALSMGAQDFIGKPYKADIIRQRLKNTIQLRETAALVNRTEKDELTGLYNKQFFLQKLEELLKDNPDQEYDLIYIGIEHFKLINDTYGIFGGDKVLRHFGQVLQDASRTLNLCGRFEGDNFFTVMPHIAEYNNAHFKKWVDKLNEYPIAMDIRTYCGIYPIHDHGTPVLTMCDRAQLAADKNRGKYDEYFYMYDDSLREKLLVEQFITGNMEMAVEQRQFQVYYHPAG